MMENNQGQQQGHQAASNGSWMDSETQQELRLFQRIKVNWPRDYYIKRLALKINGLIFVAWRSDVLLWSSLSEVASRHSNKVSRKSRRISIGAAARSDLL